MKHWKNTFKIGNQAKMLIITAKDKNRREEIVMIGNAIYIYIHINVIISYMCKNLMKHMQSFCKRMLSWKFTMSCKDNKYQIPKRMVDK